MVRQKQGQKKVKAEAKAKAGWRNPALALASALHLLQQILYPMRQNCYSAGGFLREF